MADTVAEVQAQAAAGAAGSVGGCSDSGSNDAGELGRRWVFVLLDSDAYFRAMDVGVLQWLDKIGIDMYEHNDDGSDRNDGNDSANWSLLVSGESPVADSNGKVLFGRTTQPQRFNTGVMIWRVGVDTNVTTNNRAAKRRSDFQRLLEIWKDASGGECSYFARRWAWEQSCLERLFWGGLSDISSNETNNGASNQILARSVVRRYEGHMNDLNGPWGVWVRHLWSGVGGAADTNAKRAWMFDDHMASWGITDQHGLLTEIATNLLRPLHWWSK
jgi:hypothetical protein